jgi:2-polyprenyl-3-methyl-5-hydroxy-6-metoxy-1,4-benzoquinol methylase
VKFGGSFWRRLRGNRGPLSDDRGSARRPGDFAPDELAAKKSALADAVRKIARAEVVLNATASSEASAVKNPDLVVCFDVLTQVTSLSDYQTALDALTRHGVPILLSGLDFPPMPGITHLHFFEALSTSLETRCFIAFPVDSYDGVSVLVAIPSASISPRDIAPKTLRTAIDLSPTPLLLFESIVRSRALLGFFPDHLPRCIEYSWIATHLPHYSSLRVVDVGAGVSVLPFMLADRGHRVLTADPHSIVRRLDEKNSWTEWGYLDYSQIDDRITSLNLPYQDLPDNREFDAVVSVSVVEHLPREIRYACIRKAYRQLRSGGMLLLTVDTEPFSNRLWNYSEGILVDDASVHGTVEDLTREVMEAGFTIELLESLDRVPLARVGMARIKARKAMQKSP